jgi:hypothetical protein
MNAEILFPLEEEVVVSGQASVVEGQLVPIRGLHDIVADEVDQFPDFDPRLLEIIDERLGERAVLSRAIHRNLAGSSRVDHHGTGLRFDGRETAADRATCVAGRNCSELAARAVSA